MCLALSGNTIDMSVTNLSIVQVDSPAHILEGHLLFLAHSGNTLDM